MSTFSTRGLLKLWPKLTRKIGATCLIYARFISIFECLRLKNDKIFYSLKYSFWIMGLKIKNANLTFFEKKIWKSHLVELKKLENDIRVQILTPTLFYGPISTRMSFSNFLSSTRWIFQIFLKNFWILTSYFKVLTKSPIMPNILSRNSYTYSRICSEGQFWKWNCPCSKNNQNCSGAVNNSKLTYKAD